MAKVVYLSCALMSLGCAFVLIRSYLKNKTQLLFWSGLCFIGIAINNVLLFVDLMLGPSYDLSLIRAVVVLCAMVVLLYGLIWETI